MKKQIESSEIYGTLKVPASKSYMQRAVAAALLADGKTRIYNPSFCKDAVAAMNLAADLGAVVEKHEHWIDIKGGFPSTISSETSVNINESGLGIRLFTPIAALSTYPVTINARGSLLKRPLHMMQSPLESLGAHFSSSAGFPPVTVRGPLMPGTVRVDGSLSSQFITGLLTALSAAEGNSVIEVDNLSSKPYIDMTLSTLKNFGIDVETADYSKFYINGPQTPAGCSYTVESDWSCAAALLTAGAIGGSVTIENLSTHSVQADRAILDAFESAGAAISSSENSVTVTKRDLNSFSFDATDCPDLFPPLVALAANCKGVTEIKGADRLTHKESNRSLALKETFGTLGIRVELKGDTMLIEGGNISGGQVDSFNDHRIAMAAALAGINAEKTVIIERWEAVEKSWPDFFKDFAATGGKVV